ncbi:MAG: hypothetical protein K2M37_04440 [Muribaculaceae bacterium]|nr:hypothetical protein [Muribaculaceae bacterium]
MKNNLIIAGLAVASAFSALAATEKIEFVNKNDKILKAIRVENIQSMNYIPSESADGLFEKLRIVYTNGEEDAYNVTNLDIRYTPNLPTNPLSIEVIPHYHCCTLNVGTSDPNAYYRFSGTLASNLEGIDHAEWAEYLVNDDINYIKETAETNGLDLATIDPRRIFDQGEESRLWFASEIVPTGKPTPLVIAAYTARLTEDGDVEVTSEPELIEFSTKELVDVGVKFNIDWKMDSTTLEVTADSGDSDIPFCVEVYTADQILSYSLSQLVAQTCAQYEQMVYLYGASWDDVTFRKKATRRYTNMRMGDMYLIVAFGCEIGIPNTDASFNKEYYEALVNDDVNPLVVIPEPAVTNDCTFELSSEQASAMNVNLTVTPSDPDTRWVTFMVESSSLGDNLSPEQYVSNRIYWYKYTNQIDFATSELVHTGEATLDSQNDVIDGQLMKTGVEYTFLTCGIADDGGRCTVIASHTAKTEEVVVDDDITFDVNFSNFEDGSWAKYVTVSVTPSTDNVSYVCDWIRASNDVCNFTLDDETFINRYLATKGSGLSTVLYTGDLERKYSMVDEFDASTYEYVPQDYCLIIFAYEGDAKSPLTVYKYSSGGGEAQIIRGPGVE